MSIKPFNRLPLAVSWDQQRVHYVLAQSASGRLLVQAVGSIARDEKDSPTVRVLLEAELRNHRIDKATLLVGLRRSQLDVVDMTFPPATDHELPELVRNQWLQQSADVTDDCVIDFAAFPSEQSRPRRVTAALATPELLKSVDEQCGGLCQSIGCIALRPLAAASLFGRIASNTHGNSLLISLLTTEADFSIISRGHVIYSRSIRLAKDLTEDALAGQLVTEINRTLMAAPHDTVGDSQVEHIYMFGSLSEQKELLKQLADRLEHPVSLLDPFEGVEVSPDVALRDVHRYAGLLGLIRDQLTTGHAIDFVNPKKPPEPPNYRRKIVTFGAVAIVLVGLAAYLLWGRVQSAHRANQELAENRNTIRHLLQNTSQKAAVVDAIRGWQATEVNWLDELRDLSVRFPGNEDLIVRRVTMNTAISGSALIEFQVQVRQPAVLAQLEQQLRDSSHQVDIKGALQRSDGKEYPWQSSVSVQVKPRDKQQYLGRLRPAPSMGTSAAGPTAGPTIAEDK